MTEAPLPKSVPVSLLIPVRNEAENMQACLDSVEWADEVVVVDSNSTDSTCRIADTNGATVVQFRYVQGGPKKKNWALENFPFRNQWILILDADERITPELANEIRNVVKNPAAHAGYYINRRFFFLGRFIRHAGYYPSWNLRLLRKGLGFYEKFTDSDTKSGDNEVHEHVLLTGSAGYLSHPMDHFAFPTINHFLEKHMRYSSWEAKVRAKLEAPASLRSDGSHMAAQLEWRRRLKRWARRFPFPHWLRFVFHYFVKLGFLDGREGYIFCHLLAEYEFWILAKQLEAAQIAKTSGSSNAARAGALK